MTHNSSIRGGNYKNFDNACEMRLFSFLKENKDLEVNIDNIKKMYQVLCNDDKASFRKENVHILTDEDKFYIPTSKDNIEKEMIDLCDRYNYLNHPKKEDFDDVFKFVLEFICIHPFDNGNGRLSSFIIQLLLTKFGLENALYLPFDALLNGLYISNTTKEIRKASGFFYKMKEYEYNSYILYMKDILMKSYILLKESIDSIK